VEKGGWGLGYSGSGMQATARQLRSCRMPQCLIWAVQCTGYWLIATIVCCAPCSCIKVTVQQQVSNAGVLEPALLHFWLMSFFSTALAWLSE
jgi:hypothetical protein